MDWSTTVVESVYCPFPNAIQSCMRFKAILPSHVAGSRVSQCWKYWTPSRALNVLRYFRVCSSCTPSQGAHGFVLHSYKAVSRHRGPSLSDLPCICDRGKGISGRPHSNQGRSSYYTLCTARMWGCQYPLDTIGRFSSGALQSLASLPEDY